MKSIRFIKAVVAITMMILLSIHMLAIPPPWVNITAKAMAVLTEITSVLHE